MITYIYRLTYKVEAIHFCCMYNYCKYLCRPNYSKRVTRLDSMMRVLWFARSRTHRWITKPHLAIYATASGICLFLIRFRAIRGPRGSWYNMLNCWDVDCVIMALLVISHPPARNSLHPKFSVYYSRFPLVDLYKLLNLNWVEVIWIV